MNRYIVVDIERDMIYSTNDLHNILDEEFDRFGSSIACINHEDLGNEMKNIANEIINEYFNIYQIRDICEFWNIDYDDGFLKFVYNKLSNNLGKNELKEYRKEYNNLKKEGK